MYLFPRKPKGEWVAAFVKVTEASLPGVPVSRMARGGRRGLDFTARFPQRVSLVSLPLPVGTPVPREQGPSLISPRYFLSSRPLDSMPGLGL